MFSCKERTTTKGREKSKGAEEKQNIANKYNRQEKEKIKRKRPRKIKKVKFRYFKVFISNLYPFIMNTETNEKEGGGDGDSN